MKKNRKYFLDEAEKLINGPRAKESVPASGIFHTDHAQEQKIFQQPCP